MSVDLVHEQELADFREWARELRNARIEQRAARPTVRFWDGNYAFRGRCTSEQEAAFPFVLNETGMGDITLPIDNDDRRGTFLAHWIYAKHLRGTKDVHITVDKDGARWSGRMEKCVLKRDPKGDSITVTFSHDFERLKNVHCAPNPFLPLNIVQWPKVFMLAGPAIHTLKLALFLNLLRLRVTSFELPSDPMNPLAWVGLDFSDWPIVVKPGSLADDVSMWTIVSSKMKSWADMAAGVLDDAELYVECRRWLDGDPEPWPGANLRHGTLVVDIIDKSGFRSGTSFGGNLITGLTRAVQNVTSNEVEDEFDLITGDYIPDDNYRIPNLLLTVPANPYVVYRDGDITGIQSGESSFTTAGACRITTGGRSAPGVNELIQAAVKYGGNVLGNNLAVWIGPTTIQVGALGGPIDTFLNPLYKDALFSHNSVPLLIRAAESGHFHELETIVSGSNQAYVLSAFIGLRKRKLETDATEADTFVVMDASPWLIGDQGQGHYFLGDRIGRTNKYTGTRVVVRRVSKLDLAWGSDKAVAWQPTIGDLRTNKDALTKGLDMLSNFMADLQEIGFLG